VDQGEQPDQNRAAGFPPPAPVRGEAGENTQICHQGITTILYRSITEIAFLIFCPLQSSFRQNTRSTVLLGLFVSVFGETEQLEPRLKLNIYR
jgi:hypothetical protein